MAEETAEAQLDVSGTYRVAPEDSISVVYQHGRELTFVNSRWGPRRGTLSGDTIRAKVMLATFKGVFKDGVITWNTGHVATRTGPAPEDATEATKSDMAWYPGRHLKEGLDKLEAVKSQKMAAKSMGQYQKAGNKLAAKFNAMKRKRQLSSRRGGEAVGSVHVSVLGGRFSTARPYFVVEMDGNEERSHSALTSNPQWGSGSLPKAEFILPVYDPSSDLRLFLCDDASFANETAVGRVIIPIRDLCSRGLLQLPKPTHRVRFQVIPATRQWSRHLEPRYEEAVPNVPGSGMVRPSKDLGYVDLELRLELTVPGHRRFGLLAAYAQASPPDPWLPDDSDDPDISTSSSSRSTPEARQTKSKIGVNPKVLRGNINRLKRWLHVPYLLQGPQVFTLPVLLLLVCIYAEPYHIPWVALGLVVASGILDHRHRNDRTKDMIFWEESVGKNDMPRGLQALKNFSDGLSNFQELLAKAATVLEKQRNLVNFADGSVSLVALICLTALAGLASALLYLLTMRVISFIGGMVPLLPFLARAAKGGEPSGGSHPSGQQPSEKEQDLESQAQSQAAGARQALLKERSGARPLAKCLRMFLNVLGRVPDAKDIAHWHFCAQQVLSDRVTEEPVMDA